jgi:hypothetical protein
MESAGASAHVGAACGPAGALVDGSVSGAKAPSLLRPARCDSSILSITRALAAAQHSHSRSTVAQAPSSPSSSATLARRGEARPGSGRAGLPRWGGAGEPGDDDERALCDETCAPGAARLAGDADEEGVRSAGILTGACGGREAGAASACSGRHQHLDGGAAPTHLDAMLPGSRAGPSPLPVLRYPPSCATRSAALALRPLAPSSRSSTPELQISTRRSAGADSGRALRAGPTRPRAPAPD